MDSADNFGGLAVCAVSFIFYLHARSNVSSMRSPSHPSTQQMNTTMKSAPSLKKLQSENKMSANTPLTGKFSVRVNDLTTLRSTFKSADCANDSKAINHIIDEEDVILGDVLIKSTASQYTSEAFHRAGPRAVTHFNPVAVRAAIVTCGGLCPGLNNVIRELVHSLHFLYSAKSILGVIGGFDGFSESRKPLVLTIENTADIHHRGGTILASSRGGFDLECIISFLLRHDISQLYIIGGNPQVNPELFYPKTVLT